MTLDIDFAGDENFDMDFGTTSVINTGNYDDLFNKPEINDVVVAGKKRSIDYNLQDKMYEATVAEIEQILYLD